MGVGSGNILVTFFFLGGGGDFWRVSRFVFVLVLGGGGVDWVEGMGGWGNGGLGKGLMGERREM